MLAPEEVRQFRMKQNEERKEQAADVVNAALVLTINLSYLKRKKTKAERRLMEACGIYVEEEKTP